MNIQVRRNRQLLSITCILLVCAAAGILGSAIDYISLLKNGPLLHPLIASTLFITAMLTVRAMNTKLAKYNA